jgi:hypothetical protein
MGQEIRAQHWDDWLKSTAEGERETQGFADLMLAGDQDGIIRALELLPALRAEMDKLREWLKTLARDWPTVFDQGWLRWSLTHNLALATATELAAGRTALEHERPQPTGNPPSETTLDAA